MNAEQDAWIVRAMCEPGFYDHPVAEVALIETHISWVFLAGDFAYKVKKPLDFGFLDFSTLAKRHHYCREELRLNRRFSANIYLALIQIGGSPDAPIINGDPALEYAVKMRRFPQDCQLDRMLAAGQLQTRHLVVFADMIAAQHQRAATAEADSPYGRPAAVIDPALENFPQLSVLVKGTDHEPQLAKLEQWTGETCDVLQPVFRQRKVDGFIRECHGDLHLANMAWLDGQPLLFDCIEFNENLRWIDVVNEIAFLAMDLDDREQTELGWVFLNRYLHETGDYRGVSLLNFYKTYRAMVRAKVTGLRLAQDDLDATQRQDTEHLFRSYLDLAEKYTLSDAASLIITHGLSGSGKSTFAAQLAGLTGCIHLRSDLERKRLHGLAATADSESPVAGGIYSASAFAETYTRLRNLAGVVLRSGHQVIVDATFIRHCQRRLFCRLAEELSVPLVILDFPLSAEELRRRIEQRAASVVDDASEAGVEILEYQIEQQEPLTAAEQQHVITIHPDSTAESVVDTLRELVEESAL
ncbi:MAG: AAA family ATPase [Desulfuromonadales bacterium]